MGKKNDNTLVKNASFLMVAALISKIIGMLYKSPLSTTLGSQSFALFQFAQNVYFILLMIASFSIPQAVSKIMAEKIAFHRYKDAQKVFYVLIFPDDSSCADSSARTSPEADLRTMFRSDIQL